MQTLAKKAIIVGFDGASMELVRRMAEEGHAPNIAKLLETGVHREMIGVLPTLTPPGWTTLATGCWPGTHKITEFGIRNLDSYIDDSTWGINTDLCEAEYLWKAARWYVRKRLRHKIFLYLATIDPHVAYDPPEKFLKWYYPGKYRGPVPRRVTGYFLQKIVMKRVKLDRPDDRKRYMSLYYAEISYNDHWFGRMLRDLKRMGILDQSAIVISTDHGEQFFEHGSVGHGSTLYEPEIAAPLIIRWPGLPDRQIRIPYDVEVIDIYSTLLDLAGIRQNPATQSRSLLPMVRGGRAEAMHAAFSFNYEGTRSVKVGRYKLIMYRPGRYRFYDLKTDPTEQRKVQDGNPIAFRMCKNIFSIKNANILRWRKTRWGEASNLSPQFNADFGL